MIKVENAKFIIEKYFPELSIDNYNIREFNIKDSYGQWPAVFSMKLERKDIPPYIFNGVTEISLNIDLGIKDIYLLYGLEN